MSINILDLLMKAAGPAILGQLGGMLGENQETTQKGLGAVLAAILGGLIGKAGNAQGAEAVIGMMRDNKIDGGLLDNLGGLLGGGDKTDGLMKMGAVLAPMILGDKLGPIGALVGQFAGMKGGGVEKLIGLAAPLVLGGLAKQAPAGGFTPQGLLGLLDSQKDHVAKMAPPGLGALLGLAAPAAAPASVSPPPPPPAAAAPAPAASPYSLATAGGSKLPMILAGLGLVAILFSLATCNREKPAAIETPTITAPAPGELTLPGGAKLTVQPGSIGEQLFQFLSGADAAPKTFVFDNLTFDTGSATLTGPSAATVDAIVQILKAFPNVKASIDGYTDNQGGAAANKRLSDARAKSVADTMIAAGIAADRLATAGHGPEKPIADNATPEGREKNRRIELTVTAK
jgi:outer membrane protein OmpA-like peptidoglycan-associated protein